MTPPSEVSRAIRMVIDEALQHAGGGAPGERHVPEEDPLAGRAIDSIGMVRLLAGLEERFGITIPPEEIAPGNFATLAALEALVQRLTR